MEEKRLIAYCEECGNKITKEDKEEYIKALVDTREKENLDIFREFMSSMTEKNLSFEIEAYLKSIE